jgi:hypothetical protein
MLGLTPTLGINGGTQHQRVAETTSRKMSPISHHAVGTTVLVSRDRRRDRREPYLAFVR